VNEISNTNWAAARTPVLVVGVFDLFHRGHVELLRKAREFGDRLLVVVNGDAFTSAYKRKPFQSEEDRLQIVLACRYVDFALVSNIADVKPIVEKFNIRSIVHGDDWEHSSYLRQICVDENYLRQKSIAMHYTPYYKGESTSGIIARIAASR
jgi:glycerol-3-phosphate cytidylyltransferase